MLKYKSIQNEKAPVTRGLFLNEFFTYKALTFLVSFDFKFAALFL